MKNVKYLMFLDTETSDLPRHWHTSAREFHKWPVILQIAWQIYAYDQLKPKLVKKNATYIKLSSIDNIKKIIISQNSFNIHGISEEISNKKGLSHTWVIQEFNKDFFRYMPTLVAHCVDFDIRTIAAALYRIGLTDSVSGAPNICTMHAGFSLCKDMSHKMPSLQELHIALFGHSFQEEHNAINDCQATKSVFFELHKRGIIVFKNESFDYSKQTKDLLNYYGKW